MKYLLLITLLCAGISHADSINTEEPLTHRKIMAIFDDLTVEKETSIIDKGNYVLVSAPPSSYYAFTKKTHKGHPGYIEWKVRVKDGHAYLDAHGVHGENGAEFHLFEEKMNSIMQSVVKNMFATSKDESGS